MFCLRISLDAAAIEAIKAQLLVALPDVKSSHRVEAAARGLGFRTNAAMRAAVVNAGQVDADVRWQPFVGYLKDHGFEADPSHFYLACGSAAVEHVLRSFPSLTIRGFETGRRDYTLETREQLRERIKRDRAKLTSHHGAEEFLLSLALLARVRRMKRVSASNSYWVKHIAENFPCTYPHGLKLGPRYVANGALIAAAAHAGFLVRAIADTPNALFNMSNCDLKDLDSEVRGIGVRGRGRHRDAA